MSDSRDLATRWLNSLWYRGNRLYWLLWPVSLIYCGLVIVRRYIYRHGWMKSSDIGVPVVVIGNLTVGGTGKTPLTVRAARFLTDRGFRVGIVCRGYGGSATEWPQTVTAASDAGVVGDESVLLARATGCPVAVGPDRVAAARALLQASSLDVVLSDDGLQHYRLKRALEIVVIDGTRGLGNGLCLPAGPLREPASRLHEVDAVVVNEGNFERTGALSARTRPVRVYELATGANKMLDDFHGQSVHAVAAIGNPSRFFDLLSENELIVTRHAYADHALLGVDKLEFDDDWPVLITEKDAVKCEGVAVANIWCVVVELEFVSEDGVRFERLLMHILERPSENR